MQTTVWLILLGFFLAGYLVLEGADFGAGMLLFVFGRRDQHGRDNVIRAIAPVFLGNEVWLVAALGIVEGAFPRLDGPLLSQLYPAFGLILVSWLARDSGIWFRRHGGADWRWRWDCGIAVASGLLPFGWGVVLGNLALGAGSTPVFGVGPVLCGVLLAGFCVLHGTLFLRSRLAGSAAERVRRVGVALSVPVIGAAVLTAVVFGLTGVPGQLWPLWVLGAIVLVAALSVRVTAGPVASSLTSLALAGAVPLVSLPGFPYLPMGSTVADGSAVSTLGVLTPLLIAVSPVMIACQVALWWLSRGKVELRAGTYF